MPRRLQPEEIASALTLLYSDAESALARELGRQLGRGITSAGWHASATARAGAFDRSARDIVGRADAAMQREVGILARAAMLEGAGRAASERSARLPIDEMPPGRPPRPLTSRAAELIRRLQGAQAGAAASAGRIYRDAVQAGLGFDLSGTGSTNLARRRNVGAAVNRALNLGITAVRDSAGRNWTLAAYAEMAATTAAKQIEIETYVSEIRAAGGNLVIVSSGPQECERCRRWMGRILTLDESGRGGATIVIPAEAAEGRFVTVRVAGSLSEAIGAGLLHPRCRCRIARYRPGVTGRPPQRPDPKGQAARDRLRALERRVRQLKLREAAALGPEESARAAALVRAKQAEIRAHVADTAHLGIRRDPRRERPDLGYRPTPARG